MSTELIRQIIARSGLDAYNEEISAACDAIDAQMSALESALERLVDLCNNDASMSSTDEVIAAEATLERLYKSRKEST